MYPFTCNYDAFDRKSVFRFVKCYCFLQQKTEYYNLTVECLITDALHCSFNNSELISCNSTSTAVNKSLQICYHARSLLDAVMAIQKKDVTSSA